MVVAVNIWLSKWSKMKHHEQLQPYNMNVYICLVAGAVLSSLLKCSAWFRVCVCVMFITATGPMMDLCVCV